MKTGIELLKAVIQDYEGMGELSEYQRGFLAGMKNALKIMEDK